MVDEAKYIEAQGFEQPARAGVAVTPSDGSDLSHPDSEAATRGLYVGGAGNLVVRFLDAPTTNVTITGVLAGSVLPFRVVRVRSTGTTATSIVALY